MKADWKKEKLGELCEITSSKRFHLSERTKNGVPFYCTKEILQKLRGEEEIDCDYIDEKFYLQIKEKFGVPVTDDLLLTTRGTIGFPYLYKDTDKFYFADGNLSWFRNFSNRLNSHFLYYWFLSSLGKAGVDSIAKGTAQKAVPITGLGTLEISLPPLETQQKIASILSAYDDLIENNRKQIKLLEEAAQRLYKEWFVDLRFPGYENTPIVDGVPEGWITKTIGEICVKLNSGGTPNRKKTDYWDSKDIKWYKTKELQDCWLFDSEEYISEKGLNNSSAKVFPKNTILMAIYASPTLGRLGILSNNAACNQAALCLIPNELVSYQWLYLKLYELRDYFNSVARGAGQQNISADVVKNKMIVIPKEGIMMKFTQIVSLYFDKIKSFQRQIYLSQQARDKLLPRLMSGEMEV